MGPIAFALGFAPDRLSTRVWSSVGSQESRILQQFLTRAGGRIGRGTERRAPIAVQFSDPSLRAYERYVNWLVSDELIAEFRDELGYYDVVFDVLKENADSVDAAEMFLTGVRETIPTVVLTFSMNQQDAEEAVFRIQKRFRQRRDKEIYSSAIIDYLGPAEYEANRNRRFSELLTIMEKTLKGASTQSPDGTNSSEISELESIDFSSMNSTFQEAQILRSEDFPLWDRLGSERDYQRSDFDNREYVECLQSQTLTQPGHEGYVNCASERRYRYLFPPVSENDFLHRVKFEGLTDADRNALEGGEFRSVSFYDQSENVLWIAMDAEVLIDVLFRERGVGNLNGYWSKNMEHTKLVFEGSPRRIVNELRLTSEEQAQEMGIRLAEDLRSYRRVFVALNVLADRQGIVVEIAARR